VSGSRSSTKLRCRVFGHREIGHRNEWPPQPGRFTILSRCARCGKDTSVSMPDRIMVLNSRYYNPDGSRRSGG
jgi:hypothetical protein